MKVYADPTLDPQISEEIIVNRSMAPFPYNYQTLREGGYSSLILIKYVIQYL